MSTLTYDNAPRVRTETPVAAPAAKRLEQRQGWFKRAMARMIAARHRQAMEEVRRHGIVLPREFDQAAWKVTDRSEDSLPF
jgi:hypothetical protein